MNCVSAIFSLLPSCYIVVLSIQLLLYQHMQSIIVYKMTVNGVVKTVLMHQKEAYILLAMPAIGLYEVLFSHFFIYNILSY